MDFGGGGMNAGGAGGGGAAGIDLMRWYSEIPPISRLYLTGAFLTTAMCAVDIIEPYLLYFSWDLVFAKGQIWRLVTSYLFFGVFSVDFLFHMYFLVRFFYYPFLLWLFIWTRAFVCTQAVKWRRNARILTRCLSLSFS